MSSNQVYFQRPDSSSPVIINFIEVTIAANASIGNTAHNLTGNLKVLRPNPDRDDGWNARAYISGANLYVTCETAVSASTVFEVMVIQT